MWVNWFSEECCEDCGGADGVMLYDEDGRLLCEECSFERACSFGYHDDVTGEATT